jgi:two-component system NtrC family sensor kinase
MVERLKEQSRELQESEEEYRLLTDNVSDVVFSLDTGGRLLFINMRIESITGRNRNEFIGKQFLDLLTAESREKVRDKFQALFTEKDQSSCHLVVSLPAGSGDETNFEIILVEFLDPSGIVRYYGVARDMTERRKLQEQLIQTEKLSSLGEIISGVAHELNNPLTSIIGLSELLLMEPGLNSEMKEELGSIREEARRTSRIVQNFLTFSRKYRPEKTICRINRIIESILEIRTYEIMVSHIKISKNLDPELPLTMADPNQLRQVFLNIINNAIQALQTAQEERSLTVSTKKREDKIEISIGNTGPVIPRDILSKIFDPFFTTKEVGKGTGLGLSVSHGIITEHGGSIYVQSKEGEGTQFIIKIPVENIPANSKKVKEEKTLWNFLDKRILVVDDEASILKFISRALENTGSTVDAAESGDRALAYLVENEYDLVISDLRMPGIDGWKLFSWVKQNRPHIAKKLIFITGDIMNPDAQAFFKDAKLPYLKKPFNIKDLKRIVETSLEKQKDSPI